MDTLTKCGYIAIVGRPNVGKSTLLNHLVEQKISVTSRKPQTTQHNITAIKTQGPVQMVFVDTPGMHKGQKKAINRYMNRVAAAATIDVDVVLFVVDRDIWTDEDAWVAEQIKSGSGKVLVLVNKVDKIESREKLLTHFQFLQNTLDPSAIIPLSALKGQNLDLLQTEIISRLPEGAHLFPEDQVTDRSSRFMAAELIREKIVRQLGAEIPYQVAVEIEEFKAEGKLLNIAAVILVERDGQKRILIGENGARLKSIGKAARLDMEQMFESKVMLKLWVKVKAGWSDSDRALRSLGYDG